MKENKKIDHKDKFTYKNGDIKIIKKEKKVKESYSSFAEFLFEKEEKFVASTMRWITIKDKDMQNQHILIKKKDGTILGGMGGSHNGEKLSDVFKDIESERKETIQKKVLTPEEAKKYIDNFKAEAVSADIVHTEMSLEDKDINIDERRSINAYTTNCYSTMNRLLRNPDYYDKEYPEDLTDEVRKQYEGYIKHCYEALKRNKTTKPMIAYRGTDYTLIKTFSKMSAGDIITDEGFVSTSTKQSIAEEFSGDGYVMTVLIPKGSQAASVKSISRHAKESEVLINKKARFEVKEINHDKKKMTIELLPHEDD